MPDKFTEVTTRGWGKNIMDSIKGVIIGLILFILSFVVLWINEGRQDMSEAAKLCVGISADKVDPAMEGKPVSVSAKMTTNEILGDPDYLAAGTYLKLTRNVEMYAWVEETRSETEKKVGGKTETVTTYNYVKKWTSSPGDSSGFRYPDGHGNPQLTIESKSYTVPAARVGIYGITIERMDLPSERPLELKENMIVKGEDRKLEAGYIYIGNGSLNNPKLGDVHISYTVLPVDLYVTVFGRQNGDSIAPFMFEGEHRLYRAFEMERDEAIAQLRTEFKTMGWILRAIGFLMMWIGLTMFLGPINAVLDVLPVLGSVGRGVVAFVMFFVALVLSIVTIVISMIFHNIVALIITIAAVIVIIVLMILRKKKAKTSKAT